MSQATVQLQRQPVPDEIRHWGVESVDEVLKRLKERASHRRTLEVERVADLGLRWEDEGPSRSKSGYYARISNRDYRLSDGAVKTLNRMMSGPQLKHWNKYQDPNAFVKAAVNILDNPDRRSAMGMYLRHDGLEVNCFLPSNYVLKDAHEQLTDFVEMLNDNIGDIRGVTVDEEGYGDRCWYRVIMGDNLMPAARAEHGQYMMFLLSMSETGQCDTSTQLGLYRGICTNSAIREQTISRWNNRSGGESKFYDATGETIRMTGYLKSQFAAVFGELFNLKLEGDPIELLNTMKQARIISREHWATSKVHAEMSTEDGRPCTTHYDLFNAMTHGAKELGSLLAREQAEQTTLHLFTAPNGLYGELRSAMNRRRIRNTEENVAALN